MTIDEAIDILGQDKEHPISVYDDSLFSALQLGIEALERLTLIRQCYDKGKPLSEAICTPLPSETGSKEGE